MNSVAQNLMNRLENSSVGKRQKTRGNHLLTSEIKTALNRLAASKDNGKITRAEARAELTKIYPSLGKELNDSKSKLYETLCFYLSRKGLVEKVQVQEKRLTRGMKTALNKLAASKNNMKITRAEARDEWIKTCPDFSKELNNPRSPLNYALDNYLRRNDLLEKAHFNEILTRDMKAALGELVASKNNGTISLETARKKLIESYPDLDEKELRDPKSKLYLALRQHLFNENILETVNKKWLTAEIKTALNELAASENNGTITLDAARTKLINLDSDLAQDLQNSTSNLYMALYNYLNTNKIFKKVCKERLTQDMKISLKDWAKENNGKITQAEAFTKLNELYPYLTQDKSSISKLYFALLQYLSRNKLLEKVRNANH